MGTADVFGRRGRWELSTLRERKHMNNSAVASPIPPAAEPIAIPTMAPVDSLDGDGPAADEGPVAVATTVEVEVNIGGKATVGGISIDEHAVRFVDKQQKDVAFGDVRPQYWHNCGRLVPKPQF